MPFPLAPHFYPEAQGRAHEPGSRVVLGVLGCQPLSVSCCRGLPERGHVWLDWGRGGRAASQGGGGPTRWASGRSANNASIISQRRWRSRGPWGGQFRRETWRRGPGAVLLCCWGRSGLGCVWELRGVGPLEELSAICSAPSHSPQQCLQDPFCSWALQQLGLPNHPGPSALRGDLPDSLPSPLFPAPMSCPQSLCTVPLSGVRALFPFLPLPTLPPCRSSPQGPPSRAGGHRVPELLPRVPRKVQTAAAAGAPGPSRSRCSSISSSIAAVGPGPGPGLGLSFAGRSSLLCDPGGELEAPRGPGALEPPRPCAPRRQTRSGWARRCPRC